jgi:hypothetical protein
MTSVLEGDTVSGFQDAWRAMFAHSLIHMNRRVGINFPGVMPGNPRVPASIMSLAEAPVAGLQNGSCDAYAGMGHTH